MSKTTRAPQSTTHVIDVADTMRGMYHVRARGTQPEAIAIRADLAPNREVIASLRKGYHVSVTFVRGPKGEQVFTQATLTGIVGEYTNGTGKLCILASYAQSAKVQASDAAVDRRQAGTDTRSKRIAQANDPVAQLTAQVAALSDMVRMLATQVVEGPASVMLPPNVVENIVTAVHDSPRPTVQAKRTTKAPSAAQLANRQAFAERAKARKAAAQALVSHEHDIVDPTPEAAATLAKVTTAPKAGKCCASCGGSMVIGYRHIAVPDVKVCNDCMDLTHDEVKANVAERASVKA